MSKFAVLFLIAATCASGCRHLSRLDVKESQSASYPTDAPTTSKQQRSENGANEAVPAEKGLAEPIKAGKEPPSMTPKPTNYEGPIASSQTSSVFRSVRLFKRAKTGAPKVDEPTKTATVASKPASTPEKGVAEKGTSATQLSTPMPGLPRDFWYAVIGTVFTCICAPIVVEIIKGRMAITRFPADSRRPITM